jgi:ABC-type arginine transport system permease subunit
LSLKTAFKIRTALNEQKNDTNKTTSDEPFIKSLGYSTIVVLLVIIAIVSVILLIITYYGSKKSINFISNINYNLGFNNYILYYFVETIIGFGVLRSLGSVAGSYIRNEQITKTNAVHTGLITAITSIILNLMLQWSGNLNNLSL